MTFLGFTCVGIVLSRSGKNVKSQLFCSSFIYTTKGRKARGGKRGEYFGKIGFLPVLLQYGLAKL